ncbi:GNAT family N-acetyltransferase [Bacillus mangrovi]|uniref:GNAT family N-acetyltransferase n=2 Tax=Metabacillus mangrovi TaxID=1491830 RepID=A0A7X2V5Y6_9BACI|nr:GNAT family N-acetyltransferase [Metabacillus mangrovi]
MQISQTKDYTVISKLNRYVHELHTALYPEYFKPYHFEEIQSFFQKIINRENYLFLLIQDGEQPAGYLWAEWRQYPENAFKKAYQSLYIHQISIASEYQNKGCGTLMLEEAEQLAKAGNCSKIELDYWAGNENAKRFYEKNGFSKHREFVFKDIN